MNGRPFLFQRDFYPKTDFPGLFSANKDDEPGVGAVREATFKKGTRALLECIGSLEGYTKMDGVKCIGSKGWCCQMDRVKRIVVSNG